MGLAAVALCGAGCAGGMLAPSWPESAPVGEGSAGSLAVSESHVPRVRCYDGSSSITSCSPQRPHEQCCVNEGGVYRDAWGAAVPD